MIYRFFCLLSHYRKSLVFTYENLDNAKGAYEKLVAKIAQLLKAEQGEVDKAAYDKLREGFTAAMDNDINTSLAITALYDVLKADTTPATKLALIADFDKVLSLSLIEKAKAVNEKPADTNDELPAEILELAEQRKQARKDKNFALADELRDKITAMGYTVEETRQGTVIKKK